MCSGKCKELVRLLYCVLRVYSYAGAPTNHVMKYFYQRLCWVTFKGFAELLSEPWQA